MHRRNQGFTLVEILIVVIILGILAAIVIPQFTEASNDARESSLASDLQTLRSQIELYKIQHLDCHPGDTTGNGVADDAANFVADLTGQTDQDGAVGTDYGPYLQQFPTNPFNALSDVSLGAVACPGNDGTGWYFNTAIGKISPNDNDSDSSGNPHSGM